MSTTETQNLCGLKKEDFQTTLNGKNTNLYILKNSQGYEVAITNYGGAVVAIMVPDKNGNVANVIQGYDNIKDIINRRGRITQKNTVSDYFPVEQEYGYSVSTPFTAVLLASTPRYGMRSR